MPEKGKAGLKVRLFGKQGKLNPLSPAYLHLPQELGLVCWQLCLWQQAPRLSVAAARAMIAAILVMVMFLFRLLCKLVARHSI